jgi:hypothetical protein
MMSCYPAGLSGKSFYLFRVSGVIARVPHLGRGNSRDFLDGRVLMVVAGGRDAEQGDELLL